MIDFPFDNDELAKEAWQCLYNIKAAEALAESLVMLSCELKRLGIIQESCVVTLCAYTAWEHAKRWRRSLPEYAAELIKREQELQRRKAN